MSSPLPRQLAMLGQKRTHSNRRQAKRIMPGQVAPCVLQFPDNPSLTPAWVHNLSLLGVAVLTSREFTPETILHALLVNGPHTFALRVEIRVVRCFRILTGEFFVGACFTRPLSHDEVVPFLV